MGYSMQERSTVNMLYSLKRICHMTPLPPITVTPPQRPLSSVPRVAVVERFDCNQQQNHDY